MTNNTSPFIPTTYRVQDSLGIYQTSGWDDAVELIQSDDLPASIIDNRSGQVVARWDGATLTTLQNFTRLERRA